MSDVPLTQTGIDLLYHLKTLEEQAMMVEPVSKAVEDKCENKIWRQSDIPLALTHEPRCGLCLRAVSNGIKLDIACDRCKAAYCSIEHRKLHRSAHNKALELDGKPSQCDLYDRANKHDAFLRYVRHLR